MDCMSCGVPLIDGTTVCPVCGTLVTPVTPPPPATGTTTGRQTPTPATPTPTLAPRATGPSAFSPAASAAGDWIKWLWSKLWEFISPVLIIACLVVSLYGVYKGNGLIILLPLGLMPLFGKWEKGFVLNLRFIAAFLLLGLSVAIYIAQHHK